MDTKIYAYDQRNETVVMGKFLGPSMSNMSWLIRGIMSNITGY